MTELEQEHFINLFQTAAKEAYNAAADIAAELKRGSDRARLLELTAPTLKAWKRVEKHLGGGK